MKIRFISILTAVVLLLSLCACGNRDTIVSSDSENSISSGQESSIVSEVEESSDVSETTKSSATVSKKSSKSSSKANQEVRLNTDLLSDFGLTYSELNKKHGKLIDAFPYGGGAVVYFFENGIGYGWEPQENVFPKKENGNYDYSKFPLPTAQAKCSIMIFSSNKLFLGMAKSLNPSEVETIYGIKYWSSGESMDSYAHFGSDRNLKNWTYLKYGSNFTYKSKLIGINTKDLEKIDPDSLVSITEKE